MALITCSACHQQYSKNLDACFHCGEPKPVFPRPLPPFLDKSSQAQTNSHIMPAVPQESLGGKVFYISALVCLLIGCGVMFGVPAFNEYMTSAKAAEINKVSITSDKTSAIPLPIAEADFNDPMIPYLTDETDYRKAVFGDFQDDQKIVFAGKVTQVVGDGYYRVSTGRIDEKMFSTDRNYFNRDIMVTFSDTPRVLEGDLIWIKGRYKGTELYETILHSKVKLPLIVADFYSTDPQGNFFSGRNDALFKLYEANNLAKEQAQAAQNAAVADTGR